MNDSKKYYNYDKKRYKNGFPIYLRILQFSMRKCQFKRHPLFIWKLIFALTKKHNRLNICLNPKIGYGFRLIHPFGIEIHKSAVVGNNVDIYKGVTLGAEHRGKRVGAPIIGNQVYIGTNAVIVGKVKIGNDVLIAPNSYINFDVPDHSIVIGNPGKIIHKEEATKCYINHVIKEDLDNE